MADRQTLGQLEPGSEVERLEPDSEPEQVQTVPETEQPGPGPEEAFAPAPRRRPLIITAACAWIFVMVLLMVLTFLIPSARHNAIRVYGETLIPVGVLTILFDIAGLIGYWQMRRSGIYALAAMTALNAGWSAALGWEGMINLLYPFLVTLVGFMYWKRMK
ncbi:MAG: hypothetical protein ACREP6_04345 [Candidatus Binataceae bacterium]